MRGQTFRRAASCAFVAALLFQQTFARQQARPPAPAAKAFELTVDSVMRGPDLVGYTPTGVYWSQDGGRVYFRWKRAGEPRLKEADLYVVNADGAGLRKLSEEEGRKSPPATGELSKDRRLTVFTEEGDVFLYEHEKAVRRQLTRTVEAESNAHFTRDQRAVYFTRQSNLYVMSLDGGSLEQLTDIRVPTPPGGAPAAAPPVPPAGAAAAARASESQEFLRKEERRLLDVVRERAEQREEQERRRRERDKDRRKPFSLTAGQTVTNLQLSPDGAYVVMAVADPAAGKNSIVPNYISDAGYTEDLQSRTKVGDTQRRSRFGLAAGATGEVKWVETGLRVEVAPRVRARTEQNATESAQRESGAQQQTGAQSGQQTGAQSGQ